MKCDKMLYLSQACDVWMEVSELRHGHQLPADASHAFGCSAGHEQVLLKM